MTDPQHNDGLLGAEERRAPRRLVAHALTLLGRMERADPQLSQAAEAALHAWRQQSPKNEEAATTAWRIWQLTGQSAARALLPMPPRAEDRPASRRRAMGLLGVVGFTAAAVAGARFYWGQPLEVFALHTPRGRTLTRTLDDGTRLDLDSLTAARVRFFRDRRTVHLLEGEARFGVTHDAERPFIVTCAWGSVQVVGTAFTVSAREGRMRVAVAEGRVLVRATNAPAAAASLTLGPGEAVETDETGLRAPWAIDVADVAAWRQGWLVFRNTPLPEVVARWNDYLGQPIRLDTDARLERLRVSGRFALRDLQGFLDALALMVPVQVRRAADGPTEIQVRR
ncbi:FecR family protein [Variovorax sp. ZT4R33]|uniref:FecR family protein n=1 Tax=Variovorax sp. ZT4R33 TaxID=3443743 RepID=UPI003F454DD1